MAPKRMQPMACMASMKVLYSFSISHMVPQKA